eukprot:CAMPEP_0194036962 /NCGR_PEP_ID=MMETSP0009_2-20130614/9337_1 /TAXON_ID=210454 /ORGANISM="Grammatophora oceanica, Strain CCMP 410" /LENGTH=398 /DNA_ID=CAMNT_0038678937 /DNA_START=154 /DNA_END=1350 /DNA_ORIENTATION=-
MNSSNAHADPMPERIDLRRQVNDARMEDQMGLVPHQGKTKESRDGPVKELTAASALTSMVKKETGHGEEVDDEEDFDIPQRFTKSGRKKATPFPMKLMKVLSQRKHADTITWLPDGKSFTIIRPKAFVAEILPDNFKQAKYSSFTRKLHRWGFQRHLRGEEAGAFFHKYFQRGRLDLVEKMTCYKPSELNKQSKGGGMSVASFRDPLGQRAQVMGAAGMHGMSAQAMQQFQLQQQLQQLQMQQHFLQQQQEQAAQHTSAAGPMSSPSAAAAAAAADNLRSPALGSMQQNPMAPQQGAGGEHLNTAIELEVSRRLKERIMTNPFSRPATLGSMMPGSGIAGGMMGGFGAAANQAQMANMMGMQNMQNLLGGQDHLNSRPGDNMSNDVNQSNNMHMQPRF